MLRISSFLLSRLRLVYIDLYRKRCVYPLANLAFLLITLWINVFLWRPFTLVRICPGLNYFTACFQLYFDRCLALFLYFATIFPTILFETPTKHFSDALLYLLSLFVFLFLCKLSQSPSNLPHQFNLILFRIAWEPGNPVIWYTVWAISF